MEWNQVEFEKRCERFRRRYPDFKNFEQPGSLYLQEERQYKIELIELYQQRVRPHLLGSSEEFLNKYIEILGSKLDSFGSPQNLISYRARITLKNLPREERIKYGGLLQSVLQQSEDLNNVAESLTKYTEEASRIRTSNEESIMPWAIRALVSLLLMLDKPDKFIYFTLTYWQESGNILIGDHLVDHGVPISREEFLKCSEFADRVRRALDDADFRPIDMVDVQSFLYVITMPAWDQAHFDYACEKFKSHYKGFIDFKNPGELYKESVRRFNDELVKIYRKELRPMLNKDPKEFLNKYHEILESKLYTHRPKQSKVWHIQRANNIPENKKQEFGELLQELVRKSISKKKLASDAILSKAFDRYGQESDKLLGNEAGITPGTLRVHGTLLLMLAQPDYFMHTTFVVWYAASEKLRGKPLIKGGSIVNGKIVQSCQELANDVYYALEDEGFHPRDMIDVQSFLWSIHDADEDDERHNEFTISEILKRIQSKGMRIDEATLKRYIHSLDTRGFLILAGPSGTGKTWLTQLYAKAIHANFLAVPVAPNWAANEDLLGYFNPIEGQFHATSFLKFVDQAAEFWDEDGTDSPEFHLILDEMNLARIEHYFSLFLSLMEMRRGNNVPETHLTGDRLIRVPPNLKFVGTVNMDETTHGFADKVFDRAQLLELSIDFGSAKEHIEQRLNDRECTKVLLDLWEAMEPASPVGFRVLDDIMDYIELAGKSDTHWKLALDEQIVSKLLPKLRGIEPAAAEALQSIQKLVETEYPLASDKCEIMLRRYKATDVVSYF